MSGNNGKQAPGIVIQERDRHLLRELVVMRVIDREQAKTVAGFGSTTRVNVRLLALTLAGLLRRFFLGTIAGGAKAIYTLSPKGAQLVNVTAHAPRRRSDEALVADTFVVHQLAINDLYCSLKYQKLPIPDVSFRHWMTFYEPIQTGLRLIPDGYFELETSSGVLSAFLEVDLGSESLKVWKEKVSHYLQFALSGQYQTRFGQTQFRVLVLAPSERRLQSIRQVVAALTEKIFWFRSLESIHRDGFSAPLWLRPKGEERLPFMPPTP